MFNKVINKTIGEGGFGWSGNVGGLEILKYFIKKKIEARLLIFSVPLEKNQQK